MKEKLAKLLEELSVLDGVPGHEQPVVRYLRDTVGSLADEVHVGVNGNIYAKKTGRKPGLNVASRPTSTRSGAWCGISTRAV